MPAPTTSSPKQFFAAASQQLKDLVHHWTFRLQRERRIQTIAVVILAVSCTSVVAESIVTTRTQRDQWTSEVSVVVLTADVPANGTLTSTNTKLISLPRALIATDAMTSLPPHTRTRIALTANTPLTQSLLIPESESIDIPNGWRVIALPQDVATPKLTPGDRVDVIIGKSVVSRECIVVSLSPLSLALPAAAVPSVTAASPLGEVFIAAQT